MLKKNEYALCDIIDVNNMGCGVARIDGMVVFVDGAVTGDRLRVKMIKIAKDYAVARIEEILEASPYRIASDCPVSGRCGGCAYRHIAYPYELELKRGYVLQAFRKAGISDAAVGGVLHTGETCGYRNKIQLPVSPETADAGYYARRSHAIITCDDCRLQSPAFQPLLSAVQAYLRKYRIRQVRHIYMRHAKGTGEIMVCPVSRTGQLPHTDELVGMLTALNPDVKSILVNVNPDDTNVILGKTCVPLLGDGSITDVLCGLRFRISPLSFYQVNHDAAELLYREAVRRVAEINPETVADLYCGTGTIGLTAAKELPGIRLKGVEIIPDAVRNARYNAELNDIRNASFLCADSVSAEVGGMECVILDPPRKGCSAELLQKIADERIRRVVYVSCNADTLARDSAFLLKNGYEMADVVPVDMFPRTGSVECVTHFDWKEG